jgi:hypothetical protein
MFWQERGPPYSKTEIMKNSILALSIVVTLLCAFLLIQKNRQIEQARVQIELAAQERDAVAVKAEEQAGRAQMLQTRLGQSRAEALHSAATTHSLQQQLAGVDESLKQPKTVSEFMRAQAIKEMLKDEAKSGIARNVNTLLKSGLAEQLHLTDEQRENLKQLLTARQSILWDQLLMPMMTGEADANSMPAAGKMIRKGIEENQAQLQALLGADGYSAYEWYEKTEPERQQVQKLGAKFEESGQPLGDDQRTQLLAALADERTKFKFTNNLDDPLQMNFDNWYENFSEEKLSQYGEEAQQLNALKIERAKVILNPEQVTILERYLAQETIRGEMVVRNTTSLMAKRR